MMGKLYEEDTQLLAEQFLKAQFVLVLLFAFWNIARSQKR